jgi:hypothetical protein
LIVSIQSPASIVSAPAPPVMSSLPPAARSTLAAAEPAMTSSPRPVETFSTSVATDPVGSV